MSSRGQPFPLVLPISIDFDLSGELIAIITERTITLTLIRTKQSTADTGFEIAIYACATSGVPHTAGSNLHNGLIASWIVFWILSY